MTSSAGSWKGGRILRNNDFITKLKNGDEAAFEQLVSACEKRVYLLALRYTNNPADAMDISQEVFIKVYRSIASFKGESSPETWVYRIAVNTALDFVRHNARLNETNLYYVNDDGEETDRNIADEDNSPHTIAERSDLRDSLTAAIASLPDDQKQVVIMRDINDLSYRDIAEILSLSEGTVKSRLFRARIRLQEILSKDGNFPSSRASNDKKGGGKND